MLHLEHLVYLTPHLIHPWYAGLDGSPWDEQGREEWLHGHPFNVFIVIICSVSSYCISLYCIWASLQCFILYSLYGHMGIPVLLYLTCDCRRHRGNSVSGYPRFQKLCPRVEIWLWQLVFCPPMFAEILAVVPLSCQGMGGKVQLGGDRQRRRWEAGRRSGWLVTDVNIVKCNVLPISSLQPSKNWVESGLSIPFLASISGMSSDF